MAEGGLAAGLHHAIRRRARAEWALLSARIPRWLNHSVEPLALTPGQQGNRVNIGHAADRPIQCHCEERSDAAIPILGRRILGIAALRSQ